MKKFFALLFLFGSHAFAADYVFHASAPCAKDWTLKFSSQTSGKIISRDESPTYVCTRQETPAAQEDDGCRESAIIGKKISFVVEAGTLTYTDDQAKSFPGPLTLILVSPTVKTGDLTSDDQLSYSMDSLNLLGTPAIPGGQGSRGWIFEDYRSPLSNPPQISGLQKQGDFFPEMNGSLNGMFNQLFNVHVYIKSCEGTVLFTRQ